MDTRAGSFDMHHQRLGGCSRETGRVEAHCVWLSGKKRISLRFLRARMYVSIGKGHCSSAVLGGIQANKAIHYLSKSST